MKRLLSVLLSVVLMTAVSMTAFADVASVTETTDFEGMVSEALEVTDVTEVTEVTDVIEVTEITESEEKTEKAASEAKLLGEGGNVCKVLDTEYSISKALVKVSLGGTITMISDVTIDKPVEISQGSNDSPVIIDLAGHTVKLTETGKFYVKASGYLIITDSAPDGKKGMITGYGQSGNGDGGAIYNEGHCKIENCTISGCHAADNGGAVYNYSDGYNTVTFSMENATITGCVAENGSGGAVYNGAKFSQFIVGNKSTITDCHADNGYGGVVYNYGNSSATKMEYATISKCSAKHGGVVYNGNAGVAASTNNSKLSMSNVTVTGCTAAVNGGAVFSRSSIADHSCVTVSGCSANNGGVLYVDTSANARVTNWSKISGCTATGKGGAICSEGVINFSDVSITGCSAVNGGGAVYAEDGVFIAGNNTISGNTVGSKTSNIELAYPSIMLDGNTTGEIGITRSDAAEGKQFGSVYHNSTGAKYFVCDTDDQLEGFFEPSNETGSDYSGMLKWAKSTSIKVIFDAQGGTVTPEYKRVWKDEKYGELPVPEYIGQKFAGWYTGENGTGTQVTAETMVTLADEHTLYAKWSPVIVQVTSVKLNKASLSLKSGSSEQLIVTILPDDATDKTVTWSTSDDKVATVSGGLVTAKAAGTAQITVTTNDGSFKATCYVTVTSAQKDEQKEEKKQEQSRDSDESDPVEEQPKGYTSKPTSYDTGIRSNPATDGTWTYDNGGKQYKTTQQFKNTWGFINESGNESWYYFDPLGNAVTGWNMINGTWYFFGTEGGDSGRMKTGWIMDGNKWYYLSETKDNSEGAMKIGWYRDAQDGNMYYFDSNGKMMTGWMMVGGKWYYMNTSSQTATWVLGSDGKWTYVGKVGTIPYGAMLINTVTPDGYKVDGSGQWIQ